MKQITIIILLLFAFNLQSQDTIRMSVDYVEVTDSTIQKVVTYVYPNGREFVRKDEIKADSIFLIEEEEDYAQALEDRSRLIEEINRMVLEVQELGVFLQQSDVKFKALKAKKDKASKAKDE